MTEENFAINVSFIQTVFCLLSVFIFMWSALHAIRSCFADGWCSGGMFLSSLTDVFYEVNFSLVYLVCGKSDYNFMCSAVQSAL